MSDIGLVASTAMLFNDRNLALSHISGFLAHSTSAGEAADRVAAEVVDEFYVKPELPLGSLGLMTQSWVIPDEDLKLLETCCTALGPGAFLAICAATVSGPAAPVAAAGASIIGLGIILLRRIRRLRVSDLDLAEIKVLGALAREERSMTVAEIVDRLNEQLDESVDRWTSEDVNSALAGLVAARRQNGETIELATKGPDDRWMSCDV